MESDVPTILYLLFRKSIFATKIVRRKWIGRNEINSYMLALASGKKRRWRMA